MWFGNFRICLGFCDGIVAVLEISPGSVKLLIVYARVK
jgi:hypothetical protein